MSTQKKLIIAIIAVCVALVTTIVTLIVAVVASVGSTTSSVNVEFTATNVSAIVQASYTVGGETTILKNGNQTSVVFDGKTSSGGYLNNSGLSIDLSGENTSIVFEYIITNTSPDVNITIEHANNSAILDNFTIAYAYSDTKVTDYSTLSTSSTYTNQIVVANATTSSSTKYIYVVVTTTDTEQEATFYGSFSWKLTR